MSLRLAIELKCKDCASDPAAPGKWREQVEDCGCPDCPLYSVRPRSRPKSAQKPAFQRDSVRPCTYALPRHDIARYVPKLATFNGKAALLGVRLA